MLGELTPGDWIAICAAAIAAIGIIVTIILHFWPKPKKKEEGSSARVFSPDQKVEKVKAKTVTTMQDSAIDKSSREAGSTYIEIKPGASATIVINPPQPIDFQDGVRESKVPRVKELFEAGGEHVAKGEYREAIGVFESCLGLEKDHEKRGAINIQLGNCYYYLRRYVEAAEIYGDGLKEAKKSNDKEGQGSALLSIGNTFYLRPSDDGAKRDENIREAVGYYNNALRFFTKNEYPAQYAGTQNNLGNAFADLSSASPEEHAGNLRKAIGCCEVALEIYAKDEYPFEYAMTLHNLGAAFEEIPWASPAERAENVRRAIECYEAALEIRKKDEYPVKYAMTQICLGNALRGLPSETPDEQAKNIRSAIACFKAALEIYAKDEYPLEYATTQHNIGAAFAELPWASPEERDGNVRRAIGCYEAALEITRKDEYPHYYCETSMNLGLVLVDIDKAKACYWLKEAYSLREFLEDQGKRLEELIEKVCD